MSAIGDEHEGKTCKHCDLVSKKDGGYLKIIHRDGEFKDQTFYILRDDHCTNKYGHQFND